MQLYQGHQSINLDIVANFSLVITLSPQDYHYTCNHTHVTLHYRAGFDYWTQCIINNFIFLHTLNTSLLLSCIFYCTQIIAWLMISVIKLLDRTKSCASYMATQQGPFGFLMFDARVIPWCSISIVTTNASVLISYLITSQCFTLQQ